MYLMIDNYDSFTAMLASYFAELGADMVVKKNDEISLEGIEQMDAQSALDGIVISPGPKSPADCGHCIQIVRWAVERRMPLLGVCLGHQVLAAAFGAQIIRGKRPMHGKVTAIHANGNGLFRGLPAQFPVTRYHSLVVDEQSLPSCLVVDARSDDGAGDGAAPCTAAAIRRAVPSRSCSHPVWARADSELHESPRKENSG